MSEINEFKKKKKKKKKLTPPTPLSRGVVLLYLRQVHSPYVQTAVDPYWPIVVNSGHVGALRSPLPTLTLPSPHHFPIVPWEYR